MNRVSVIGTSGSGKTTFAAALADTLQCPHIELDALSWEPGWRVVAPDTLRQRVIEAVARPRWVIDGNYSSVRQIIWSRVDTVVWLDYALSVVLGRSLRRTSRRIATGELACNGNRETLGRALSRDSILLWVLTTYGRRRRQYPGLLAGLADRGVRVVRLTSPKAAGEWLARHSDGAPATRPN